MLDLKRVAKFAPRAPRKAVDVKTVVLLPDDREVSITLTNISARGFTAVSETEISPATKIGINLPGFGIKRAEVRWAASCEFGGRFDCVLPAPIVDKL
jgi:hypothetical protein